MSGLGAVAVAANGLRIVASGDYKDVADPTCAPFELVRCDVFITEATFGLPVFRHGDPDGEIAKLLHSVALFPERAHRRRLLARQGATRDCLIRGRLPGADLSPWRAGDDHALLRESRRRAGRAARRARTVKAELAGAIALCPPSASTSFGRAAFDPVTSFASGWMRVRAGAPTRRGTPARHLRPCRLGRPDRHHRCDRCVRGLGHHGQEDARALSRSRGLKARPLDIVGYGDEDETDGVIGNATLDEAP
jgi:putative mRNA 3-end processing factor